MTTFLLKTKLYVPPIRPERVPRPRLTRRLSEGVRLGRKLILISAPAGFGKTMLLSEWIHAESGGRRLATSGDTVADSSPAGTGRPSRFAWLSLDESDNDPVRFLTYLVAALQTIDETIGQGVLDVLQSPRPPAREELLTPLVNQIDALPAGLPAALILDDYHLITAQPVHEIVTFLLDHLPPPPRGIHVVISTRADPPLPVARLRERGQLTEVRQADLRFTADEVDEFLNQTMGLALPIQDVATLVSCTEGWIGGLQMAALAVQARLSTRGDQEMAGFIASFSGSHEHIVAYLSGEVLDRQPEDVRAFLLQTSVLDRLTGSLCDAVTGQGEGQQTLERLKDANLFIVPMDDERCWYRYHRLFSDLLRQRLERTQPDIVPELHRRASVWYEQRAARLEDSGPIDLAIQHAMSAGDFNRAAGLIEGAAEATLLHSEVATFLGWVAALPDEQVRSRPLLRVFHAGALLLSGHAPNVVEAHLQDADTGVVAGEVAAFRALLAIIQGKWSLSAELSQRALERLPHGSLLLRGLAADSLGMAHMLGGDIEAAFRAFDDAAQVSQKTGNVMSATSALCNLAGLCVAKGQLHRAESIYRRALDLTVYQPRGPGDPRRFRPIAGRALMGLGELAREWNDLQTATDLLNQGVELSRQANVIGTLVCYLHLARVRQAQGDLDGADDAIREARQLAVKSSVSGMNDVLVAVNQVRLWLAQGKVELALRWVKERGLDTNAVGSEAALVYELREAEYITLARVYIAHGEPDKALQVLEPLLQTAQKRAQARRVIEILVLQAVALSQTSETGSALDKVARALGLAEAEGYVRLFVDEGPPIARLLYQAAERGVTPEYTGWLLAACGEQQDRLAGGMTARTPAAAQRALLEPLSERELEVLRLIAEGLSNGEIAQRLVISLSTVKGHASNVYGKLAVNNRTQATIRARGLGLLPSTSR